MKLWYIYIMEYYPIVRKEEILQFAPTMDGTGGHMLYDISQKKTDIG